MMGRKIGATEAGKILGFSRATIIKHAENGILPGWRVGERGHWRFDADDIRRVKEVADRRAEEAKQAKAAALDTEGDI